MIKYLKNLDKIKSSINKKIDSNKLVENKSFFKFKNNNNKLNNNLLFKNKLEGLLCLKSYKNIILLNSLLIEIFNKYKIRKYNNFIFDINEKIIFSLENGYRHGCLEYYYLKNKNDIINNHVNNIVEINEKIIRSQFVENDFKYYINLITRLISEITIRLQYKNVLWSIPTLEYDTLVSRRSSLLLKLLY